MQYQDRTQKDKRWIYEVGFIFFIGREHASYNECMYEERQQRIGKQQSGKE